MSQILIGLAGPARSGKDTAARYLAAQYQLLTYAFAMPLKAALQVMFNLTVEQLDGALKEQPLAWLGKSPRELLQTLGTEWGRSLVHPELWLRLAAENLANLASENQDWHAGFVISDVRFENEAAWIRQRGGLVLHIRRPDAQAVNPHASESGIARHALDMVVNNDADLDYLHAQLDHVITTLRLRAITAA